MKGVEKMILKFKSMKALELLRHFKKLDHIDQLRLSIHLLENNCLNVNITNELNILKNQLIELDEEYKTTLINFNKYLHLTFLSAKFMEISKEDKNIIMLDMIDNLFITDKIIQNKHS